MNVEVYWGINADSVNFDVPLLWNENHRVPMISKDSPSFDRGAKFILVGNLFEPRVVQMTVLGVFLRIATLGLLLLFFLEDFFLPLLEIIDLGCDIRHLVINIVHQIIGLIDLVLNFLKHRNCVALGSCNLICPLIQLFYRLFNAKDRCGRFF